MRRSVITAVVAGLAFFSALAPLMASAQDEPDAVFYNARIVTLDSSGTTAEAVAVKDVTPTAKKVGTLPSEMFPAGKP